MIPFSSSIQTLSESLIHIFLFLIRLVSVVWWKKKLEFLSPYIRHLTRDCCFQSIFSRFHNAWNLDFKGSFFLHFLQTRNLLTKTREPKIDFVHFDGVVLKLKFAQLIKGLFACIKFRFQISYWSGHGCQTSRVLNDVKTLSFLKPDILKTKVFPSFLILCTPTPIQLENYLIQ